MMKHWLLAWGWLASCVACAPNGAPLDTTRGSQTAGSGGTLAVGGISSSGAPSAPSPSGGASSGGVGGAVSSAGGGLQDTGGSAGAAASGMAGMDGGSAGAAPEPTCAFSPNDGAEVGAVPGVTPSPSQDWSFALGEASVVPNSADVPIYRWFPDGHISVLPDLAGNYLMFWAEVESYRTIGPSVLAHTHTQRSPLDQLFHGRIETSDYDNGGIWLHSVFRRSGQNLIGFFVAEDQYCCPRHPEQIAWRSVGVTQSTDNGATWGPRAQILTANEDRPSPDAAQWGGNGDGSAVWDPQNCRWMFFYQHQYVTAAVSSDPEGKPGTWFKYFKASANDPGDFTEPGLRGRDSPLEGLETFAGGNPSVHFNSYLGKWVMVYHGWDPQVSYIASSTDLIHWDTPRFVLGSANPPGRGWYPTIIGESDLRAGQKARLYYTDMDRFDARYFMQREITFTRND